MLAVTLINSLVVVIAVVIHYECLLRLNDWMPRLKIWSRFRIVVGVLGSLLAHAIEMFPFLANAKLMRQWAGITDMTPDYSPIMGLSPVKNYYLDAGWGTWGFKATPICGKTMAELVASGGKVPDLIKPFGLERFSTFQQVNEMGATAASH